MSEMQNNIPDNKKNNAQNNANGSADSNENGDIAQRVNNRSLRPRSSDFKNFMLSGWGEETQDVKPLESSRYTPSRIRDLAEKFLNERIVIPAGNHKTRSNDCTYMFRPDTSFAYYTGLGEDYEAGAVLVLEPAADGCSGKTEAGKTEAGSHKPILFVHPRKDQTTQDYYRSAEYGEYWVGPRPGLAELEIMTGFETADIETLPEALKANAGTGAGEYAIRVIRESDETITELVEQIRFSAGFEDEEANREKDDLLHEAAAEQRMIKDEYEISEMRKAVNATKRGFDEILKALPSALNKPRSERILEGRFNSVAREEGNDEGYDTIIASGVHAPTLHWMRNTGVVGSGELLLIDAGVEVNSLYTADITRTFPTDGKFTDFQRKLYNAVLESQQAGFDAANPGATYSDIHHACMRVIAQYLYDWGILPVSVEESLSENGQQHRRWLACGVAHHLGLDVHDCAQARYENYQGAKLRPGMIFTIEPGLYFRENDMLIPEEYRGIGIRIEDDVLMTENGPEWISSGIPRTAEDVEAWMARMSEAGNA